MLGLTRVGYQRLGPKKAASSARRFLATKEATGKHVPFGETGTGLYSDATKGCFDVMARLQPLAARELEKVLTERRARRASEPFRFLDLGTADGGTSMPMLRGLIAMVREQEPDVPIEVVYEDQALNDWTSVFHRVQGTIETVGAPGGLSNLRNVHVLATGLSFYECTVAPASVDLAFCSTAMHWLTNAPCEIPDALHSACSSDPTACAAFEEQAAKDWQKILKQRAIELKTNGVLVVANFAVDDEGQFLGHTPTFVKKSMHHTFAEIWKELVTPAEFQRTNFPNQYRKLEACASPFSGGSNFEGLSLVSAETHRVACPFRETFVKEPSRYTAQEQAARYVPTTRTWSNSTFESGLIDRHKEERVALVNELFRRYEARVAESPADHAMDYVHSYLAIKKTN